MVTRHELRIFNNRDWDRDGSQRDFLKKKKVLNLSRSFSLFDYFSVQSEMCDDALP